ncbi:hypothetical protein KUTeg_013131 [Tegillarca granosa]|uniref:Uncharacterized protein n=1 Tax=Tegillarca granosa TaxID=220873 RepID=A0ABQ9EST2_TEGGR|nr:hypothetical protein KUTeg_013131 [Tegillarca granosa]
MSGSSTPAQSVSSIGGQLSPGLGEPGNIITPDTKPKSPKEEEEDAIKELATSNGLNHNKLLNGETCNVEFLEMFFSGFPRIVGMHLFPCLTTLKIENLGSCKLLRKLFLYGNQITKIENLDHLSLLEVLWLNNNQIQYLEELTHLMRIPLLKNLSLKDPEYSPAPVSLLCNYSTHVLFHLPHLTKLDTYDVSKPVSDMAETTVVKKKMYYNMREKTVKRNMADILSKMEIYAQRLKAFPLERIKHLMCTMKELKKILLFVI